MPFQNQFKTVIFLGLLTALLLWIGSFWGANGLTIAIIFSVIINIGSLWFSDKLVLKIYKAKPASKTEYPNLHNMVEEIAKTAGIPKPKIFITPTQNSNAFACGRSPKHASVAFTEGIMDLLNEDELRGVAAHEIAHIKNRDTLISTVAATIAGVISYVAFMARWAAIFGGGRDRGGGIIELLVLAIITPIMATMIQLAISRSREYIADKSGASYLKDGEGLASALEKLHTSSKQHPLRKTGTTEATAHMFIMSPFRGGGLIKLFSTHPPHTERIQKLKELTF